MNQTQSRKIGLVGTGMVGASFAYALMQRSLVNEMVLIDANHERAVGEAMDLNHGLPFVRPIEIFAGDYQDLAGAAVTIVTAGAAQKPDETRLQLLERNAKIFSHIIPPIAEHNPAGVILIATNPVDIMTSLAIEYSGLPANRVFGSGTILDTARFRSLLGDYYEVDPRSVHAYIVGEHGDSELALWSLANIAGIPLAEYPIHKPNQNDAHQRIFRETRDAAYDIIKRKGATYYAIGLGLLTIVEAIVRNQHTVLTVSSMLNGQHGVEGISISLPSVVGANGIEQVLTLPISAKEQQQFQTSANTLKGRLQELRG